MFVHGAERITMEQLKFNQLDGNALMLSNYAKNNTVKDCDFWRTGDTAVASASPRAHGRATTCMAQCMAKCMACGVLALRYRVRL